MPKRKQRARTQKKPETSGSTPSKELNNLKKKGMRTILQI